MKVDYLSKAEVLIAEGPQFKDGPEYVVDYIQLGIAQQLRRIADALQGHTDTIITSDGQVDLIVPPPKSVPICNCCYPGDAGPEYIAAIEAKCPIHSEVQS